MRTHNLIGALIAGVVFTCLRYLFSDDGFDAAGTDGLMVAAAFLAGAEFNQHAHDTRDPR